MSELLGGALSSLGTFGTIEIERNLVLIGALFGVVGTTMSIFQFSWPVFRRHGFTYHIFRLAIAVAIISVVVQASALVADWLRLTNSTMLAWIAGALVVLIVFSASVYAFFHLEDRPSFSRLKLISMFALPLSPLGAFFAAKFFGFGSVILRFV